MNIQRLKRLVPARSPLRLLWHKAKALAAAVRYGFPARHLTVIGVTGTDGKTTTVGMIAHILSSQGIAVGALSTAFIQTKNHTSWNVTQKTSPSPFLIQHFLRRLVREGCTHAVLEYSSHGLVQGRTLSTWPRVAAVTNTSPEHLDYHGTMEQYRKDKGILFRMLRRGGAKVINADDGTFPLYRSFSSSATVITARSVPPSLTLSANETLLWYDNVRARPFATEATLYIHAPQGSETAHALSLSIPGVFNVENALTAIGCALGLGLSAASAVDALRSFRTVPGRMEPISGPQPFAVYVDFTVTPASYERTLTAVRATLAPGKRLHVLTGSCGDRMREKRPDVGRICSALADTVVVTNEDPYTEDPQRIIDDVWSGVDQARTKAHRIADRLEAMRFLLAQAEAGDAVLFCGKGSDTTMMTSQGQVPWNEREIVSGILRDMFPA